MSVREGTKCEAVIKRLLVHWFILTQVILTAACNTLQNQDFQGLILKELCQMSNKLEAVESINKEEQDQKKRL